jgi:hypothetical protein
VKLSLGEGKIRKIGKFGIINPLNAKLNPICHFLALLGAHLILHVSRIRVKLQALVDVTY